MIEQLVDIEAILKELKAISFEKIFEKHTNGWKVVYALKGVIVNEFFFVDLRLIFWLNEDKSELSDSVITFLSDLNGEYKTVEITEIKEDFTRILEEMKRNKSYIDMHTFTIEGAGMINTELRKKGIKNNFCLVLNFEPIKNKSIIQQRYHYRVEFNNGITSVEVKPTDREKYVIWFNDEESQDLSLEEVCKKIIEDFETQRDLIKSI